MSELEMCANCDQPTGKAGRHEDSLYLDNWAGPLCETCYEEAIPELALAYGSVKSELSRLRERVRELEGAAIQAIVWTVADACIAIDEGRNYRKESIPEIIQRAMNDLALLPTGREEG